MAYFWRMIDDVLSRARIYLNRTQLVDRLRRRGVTTRAIALWMDEAWDELLQQRDVCVAI